MEIESDGTATQEGASVHERLMNVLSDGDQAQSGPIEETPVEDVESTGIAADEEATEETETAVTEDEGAEDSEPEGDERWMPASVQELAEALEVDQSDLAKGLKLQTKVDGQIGEATLEEVVKSYQLEQHLNRRSQQMAEARKEWEQKQQQQREDFERKAKDVDDTLAALEQMAVAEYQSVNWQELQQDDPTEYLMQQQRLQQRFTQLEQVKQQMQVARDAEQQRAQEEQKDQHQQRIQQEIESLFDRVPEWRDTEKFKQGWSEVSGYLMQSYGVSDQELNTIADHRMMDLARKAMLYDRIQTQVEPKKKVLKQKPKFVPPGARKTDADEKAKRMASLKRKSKAGNKSATHALLMEKLKR